jgi:arylsulfatase
MLTTALIGSTVACTGERESPAPYGDPTYYEGNYNILFVMTDQERYFEEPPAGTDWRARELLASIGATFEKHYICANVSTSSRSVVYTGQHITKTRMVDNTDFPWQGALDEDMTTVGDRMRDAGYYTAYKGKFHMLNDGAIDVTGAGADEAVEKLIQDGGLENYGFSDWNPEGDLAGSLLQGYHADEYIKSGTVRWLREKGSELNQSGRPFFLAVNFINPHDIMYYNPVGQTTSIETGTAPENSIYKKTYGYTPVTWGHASWAEGGISAHREYHSLWNALTGDLPQEQARVEDFNDYYLNCIQDQDNALLGLLEELEHLGMMENTIIIFTSDHGEMAGAHGLKGKGNFIYEENLHVPFIIYHPAYEGGRRIGAISSHLDIVPTIMDMAGAAESGDLAGHSLLPLLSGQADSVRDGALYAFEMISMIDPGLYNDGAPDLTKRGFMRAVVTDRYKFARYFSPLDFNTPETPDELYAHNDIELYDLINDPEELNNLASDREVNAELIKEMNRQLNALIAAEIGEDAGAEMATVFNFLRARQQ